MVGILSRRDRKRNTSRRGARAFAMLLGCLGPMASCRTPVGDVADVVYVHGKVVTMDSAFTIAEAVAVKEGRIQAVGSNRDVDTLVGPGTRRIDLGGRTVLPGFYDAHVHLGIGDGPDVHDWTGVETFEALSDSLRKVAAELPRGAWIQGRLKNESFPEQRLFRRRELDAVVADRPVVLTRGAHVMILNSLGLHMAQVTGASKPAPGGSVELDATGEPTGILRESAAWRLVWPQVPRRPPTHEGARAALHATLDQLPALGITSINVAGIRPDELRYLQDLYRDEGEMLVRTTAQIRMSPSYDAYDNLDDAVARTVQEIEDLGVHTGFGDDRLRIGAIKLSIDGGLTGQGFWSLEPYPSRPDFQGVVRIPEQALYPVVKRAHELGWQLGIHAIGDAAVQMTAKVLARVLDEDPRPDHRHFLHHVSVLPPDATLRKLAEHDILVCSQPNFSYALSPYAVSSLEGERLQHNNPQMSLVHEGIRLAYGSDGMPLGPLVGIYAAVTRKGTDGEVYGADEKMSVKGALRAYTLGSAYLTFQERDKGSLEPQKLADMVVLDEDILTVDPERIKDIPVYMTVVGGEILYRDKTLLNGVEPRR